MYYGEVYYSYEKLKKEIERYIKYYNELIVIEVKTRSNTLFAEPEDAVDLPKIRRTVRAADTYIRLFQIDSPVRFDIITVVGNDGHFKVEHIEEAFYPPLYY